MGIVIGAFRLGRALPHRRKGREEVEDPGIWTNEWEPCANCDHGFVKGKVCPICKGAGQVPA